MKNKFILESMASDLKRVALGLHRGSKKMASRFLEESLKRKDELNMSEVAPYLKKFISKLDGKIEAEDALMYSTLIQNYSQKL
ncbi:hypothetical protein A2866_04440 [Candidatus Roizmanbacteria bacterium RIFCSPHIGHO2_01_FULL_39_8]|uniref:Uncharacterized protein n=2 Tax=Microgenomates group TaxID=1794810 RepID=A0A1F7GS51_9BACT|nr:MAG: hypothetical protein A3D77_00765 [Candidatus Gottesmanbacteria bacterium RIFCSPHIGHO2_02_FULL_39_11]OGK21684.1 MAG: hypothetical protein A2866_04440 [Candidatus Roizmanbacteria bacterium RIFCSPHIGHO2_01_FULL_39_8]